MYRTFDEIINCSDCLSGSNVVVASADRTAVQAVKMAFDHGLGHAVLVGDSAELCSLMEEHGIDSLRAEMVHADSPTEAARRAVAIVREGSRYTLMKGLVNSEDFLRAVLDKEHGLRTGRVMSHLAVIEIPGENRLSFCADSSFIIAPTLEQKKHIIANSLRAIHALGYEHVNIAVLAANERINPSMPTTVDAAALVEAWRAGEFDSLPCTCTIEGPMSFDVVVSKAAAEHKGILSVIAGKVDLTIVPDIECGNIHTKTLKYYCHAKSAGVVLGAKAPIALVSRADDNETKFYAMALSCLVADEMQRSMI